MDPNIICVTIFLSVVVAVVFKIYMKHAERKNESIFKPNFSSHNVPVFLICNTKDCIDGISKLLAKKNCDTYKNILALDCEWKPYNSHSSHSSTSNCNYNKVAILQLSNHKCCLLIQLQSIYTNNNNQFPLQLISLLHSPEIIKVGRNISGDCKKLKQDFNLDVYGCVDIKNFILNKCLFYQSLINKIKIINLPIASLERLDGLVYLLLNGINMNKRKTVTLSNWEQNPLTREQMMYAANDVILPFYAFVQCIINVNNTNLQFEDIVESIDKTGGGGCKIMRDDVVDKVLNNIGGEKIIKMCYGVMDCHLVVENGLNGTQLQSSGMLKISKKKNINVGGGGSGADDQSKSESELIRLQRKFKFRQESIEKRLQYEVYDKNNNLLSLWSANKAKRTVKKGLATDISTKDSFAIRLIYKAPGSHFMQKLDNICVVCGDSGINQQSSQQGTGSSSSMGLFAYDIVPLRYRKHFRETNKNRRIGKAYDTMFLCSICQNKVKQCESNFEQQLITKYKLDSPKLTVNTTEQNKYRTICKVEKAAKTLLKKKSSVKKLPLQRRNQLLKIIANYRGIEFEFTNINNDKDNNISIDIEQILTNDVIQQTCDELKQFQNERNVAIKEQFKKHCIQVANAFNNDFVLFATVWRRNFIDKMQPRFMPVWWKVEFNQDSLSD